jgi:hypothetical protein
MIRRRRVFVRASSGASTESGTTVRVGGLARTDASGGFEAEFATLAAALRSAHEQAAPAPSAQPTQPAEPSQSAQPPPPTRPAQQQAAQHRHEGE